MEVLELIKELQKLDPKATVRILRDCDEDEENYWVHTIETDNEGTEYSEVILKASE